MPNRVIKPSDSVEEDEDLGELVDTAKFLNSLRLKVFIGFIGGLMLLYSFFGNIYRVPLQMEQHDRDIAAMKATDETLRNRVIDLEKTLAVKEALLSEIAQHRTRIEAIERADASRNSMQQQLDRLEGVTRSEEHTSELPVTSRSRMPSSA